MADHSGAPSGQAVGPTGTKPGNLKPELVEEIAAKVYALLLRDLKIERERQRWLMKRPFSRGA
jgi:hypothetical protein